MINYFNTVITMESYTTLKKNNLQKYYMKIICRIIYYLGLGDCWYEEMNQSEIKRKVYKFWAIVSNFYIFSILLNEVLAYFRTDLTTKEKNDLVQFSFAHPSICAKILALYSQKKQIKVLLKRFLEDTREIYCSLAIDRAAVKKAKKYCFTLMFISYLTLLAAFLEACRLHYKNGIKLGTEVTFYPHSSSTGILPYVARFFIEVHWWFLVTMMVVIDCLCLCALVFLESKFKLLQMYFESLREKLLNNRENKSKELLEEEFKKDFIVGIQLHQETLWCSQHVQYALGGIYSVQIIESIALLVASLIKLVTEGHNLTALLANFAYILCLVIINGGYMTAAGDITYEASMLSTSMFHCGWELTRARRDLRVLAVVALQRSQVPVYMTAFGIITLSYDNFISVLRSSYSFFAVMY